MKTFMDSARGNKILGLLSVYIIHKIMVFAPMQAQSAFPTGQILICIQLVHVLTNLVIAGRLSWIIYRTLDENRYLARLAKWTHSF